MLRTVICLAGLLLGLTSHAALLVHCPRLIDVERGELLQNQTVVIEANRFAGVLAGDPEPGAADTVIELDDATCMPGLIDMHVHITQEQSPTRFVDSFRLDPADMAYRSVRYAERTLDAGFTTVRDLGAAAGLAIAMRDAINTGAMKGPRIFAAGKSLATTGGHADPTNGRNAALRGDPGPAEGVVNGVADARKAVRQRYKEGADLIKLTATGGVLSQAASGENAQFTSEELDAIIETARDYNFKVAAHAHGAEGMKRAVRAGIDSIEHGTFMDNETMKLMKKHNTAYVPTIIAGKFVAEKAEVDGYFSELVRPKAREIGPLIQETFARAYKAGVRIVFGTDTGVSPHGDNWKEFVYMVEAGMPPMEAIQSATVGGSELLGQADRLGSISAGKLADLVAVAGNPLDDIEAMGRMQLVIKDGTVFRQP